MRGIDMQEGAAFAAGDSAMAHAVRAFDWASTPLGPPSTWPLELKTAVGMALDSAFPKALVWGPQLITIYNDAFRPILGNKPEALGRSFRDVWAEAWGTIGPIADRAFAGQSTFIEDFELEVERSGRRETAWFTFCYSPIRLADGSVGGMLDTVVETTATVRGRMESDFLREELGHRLKNTLAMVQSIAWHTLRRSTESGAMDAFQARLLALGRAHDVLLQHHQGVVAMREVVDALLALHGNRFEIEGPAILLGSQAMVALSLLLHELGTNAAKYGALSVPEGRVALSWQVDGDELVLRWRERGGPAVTAPTHTGFGSRVIDMGLMGTGRAERRYPVAGIEVDLRVAVRDLAQR